MAIATDKVAVINAVDALAAFNVRFTIELFPCDVVKFLELFLVNGPSEVVRVGCYWEGHLVKRSIATLYVEKKIYVRYRYLLQGPF